MPKIDWDNTEESTGTKQADLPAGGYVCQITKADFVKTKKGQDALVIVYDIIEGEHKGYFTADFYADKDFRHNDWLMLEGKALGITKHKLHMLADSNPGFDGQSAINADQAQAFVGKLAGLVLSQRLYTYNGKNYAENRVYEYKAVDDIRAGKFEVPAIIDDRQQINPEPEVEPEIAEDDIPF